jgi:hypothetical protein
MMFNLKSLASLLLAAIGGVIAFRLLPEVVAGHWFGFIAYLAIGLLCGGLVRFFDMVLGRK